MKYSLNTDIEEALQSIERYLLLEEVDRKESFFLKLMCDDILGVYQKDPSFRTFEIQISKKKTKITISVCIPGRKIDPLGEIGKDLGSNFDSFLHNADIRYHYSFGRNIIRCSLHQSAGIRFGFPFLWREVIKNRKSFLIAVSLDILEIVIGVILPVLSARVISSLISRTLERVLTLVVILLLFRLVFAVLDRISQYFYSKTISMIDSSLSILLAEKILSVKTENLQNYGTSAFYQKITGDVDAITGGLRQCINLTSSMLSYIGNMIAMGFISPLMLVYHIITAVVMTLIELSRTRKIKVRDQQDYLLITDFLDTINGIIHGNREIKLFNKKREFSEIIDNKNAKCLASGIETKELNNRYTMIKRSASAVFTAGFGAILVLLLSGGWINPTEAVVLFNYNATLNPSMQLFESIASYYRSFSLSCERVLGFVYSERFSQEWFGTLSAEQISGAVSFEHVTFSYPTAEESERKQLVLKDMSFEIKPGEYVAITGPSGCGKTTIFNLITSLYRTKTGKVCLDGIDIKNYDEQTLRSNITLVPQLPYLFHMSIRENLLIAKPDATNEEIEEACRKACIHDAIADMEHGYDTVLTEGGGNISGGQRQRLAIAMAMLRNTPVILLDEATSALDNIVQDKIQKNLAALGGEHTIIVIAHRMSTIVNCDRILYMHDGRIEAAGTHKDLMNTCESYRALYMEESK